MAPDKYHNPPFWFYIYNTFYVRTEPDENTMLNQVVVFVIFGPKRIFDASKHSLTKPLMSHGILWWCLYFLSGKGQYTEHTCSMEGQKSLGLNLKYLNPPIILGVNLTPFNV